MTHSTTDVRTWRTITEAAALMGISVRQLERRIAAGRNAVQHVNGRRMVDCDKDATTQALVLMEAREMGQEARRTAGVMTLMLEQALAKSSEDAKDARQALKASHRGVRIAWTAAGLGLAGSVALGVWLVSYRVEREYLTREVSQLAGQLDAVNATVADYRLRSAIDALYELAPVTDIQAAGD